MKLIVILGLLGLASTAQASGIYVKCELVVETQDNGVQVTNYDVKDGIFSSPFPDIIRFELATTNANAHFSYKVGFHPTLSLTNTQHGISTETHGGAWNVYFEKSESETNFQRTELKCLVDA